RNQALVSIVTDDVAHEGGRVLERQINMRLPDASVIYTDEQLIAVMSPGIVRAAGEAAKIVVAVYASPTAGKMIRTNSGARNSLSLGDDSASLLRQILMYQAAKTVLVAMGNPYLAKDLPEVQNYLCTSSTAPGS